MFEVLKLSPGEFVVSKGDPATDLYFVVKGNIFSNQIMTSPNPDAKVQLGCGYKEHGPGSLFAHEEFKYDIPLMKTYQVKSGDAQEHSGKATLLKVSFESFEHFSSSIKLKYLSKARAMLLVTRFTEYIEKSVHRDLVETLQIIIPPWQKVGKKQLFFVEGNCTLTHVAMDTKLDEMVDEETLPILWHGQIIELVEDKVCRKIRETVKNKLHLVLQPEKLLQLADPSQKHEEKVNSTLIVKGGSYLINLHIEKENASTVFSSTVLRDLFVQIEDMIYKQNAAIDLFSNVQFLTGLPPHKLRNLAFSANFRKIRPGEKIIREGDELNQNQRKFYVINSGTMKVENTVKLKSDIHQKLATLSRGKYFGEVSMLSSEQVERVSATVLNAESTPGSVFELDRETFNQCFLSEPSLAADIGLKVLGSSCNLLHVLHHEVAKKAFTKFCAEEFASENCNFFFQIENLHLLRHTFDETYHEASTLRKKHIELNEILKERSNDIYARFIDEQKAPDMINIDSKQRLAIREAFEDDALTLETFNEAREEIYHLMERDNFARFKATLEFKTILKIVGPLTHSSEQTKLLAFQNVEKNLDAATKKHRIDAATLQNELNGKALKPVNIKISRI
eukprot:snap_masked-scaffold_11-processed-gene-10.35-mRNA-1 protein AED:1.00 eAED:1.00 QI:0/0/0/0/1/1/2/0/620